MFKVIMRCSAGVQGEGSCIVLLGYARCHEHLSVLLMASKASHIVTSTIMVL